MEDVKEKNGSGASPEENEPNDEYEWREELKDILDNIEKKGDFCTAKDVTDFIPRFSPSMYIDGLEEDGRLSIPLLKSQAKRLLSIAEKAPFGKGLDTVLDESVRKAWQIDATKVHFRDSSQWEAILHKITQECVTALGMTDLQRQDVRANLYKMLLYEKGGMFKRHRDTEKEPGMFGTLIIQLPSKFLGGALVIEHGGETKSFDFSAKSEEGFFATAFYADCEHELLPVEDGFRICLAYKLVMRQSEMQNPPTLPSASGLTSQIQPLRKLASCWESMFNHGQGYLLEHNYTETNLGFSNLKGRDKELVNFIAGARGVDGNPLFVTCLMLIEKHESGEPESRGYHSYGYRRRYDSDCDSYEDHAMGEVYESSTEINHWIGPDGKKINDLRLKFSLEDHLITDEDPDEIFGEDPSKSEYESYTGNAGPTLDYWYYRSAVVFWPRTMNTKIMKSAGVSYIASYLNVAVPSEICDIGSHVIALLEAKQLQLSTAILTGICKTGDKELVTRALKCCKTLPDVSFAGVLAEVVRDFASDEIKAVILEMVRQAAASRTVFSHHDPLPATFKFLEVLDGMDIKNFKIDAQESLVKGAITRISEVMKSPTNIAELSKLAFQSSSGIFDAFCNVVKSCRNNDYSPVLKSLISIGEAAIQHPLVIELANRRATTLREKTDGGEPSFSWKMPNARFTGSHGLEVNAFLRSEKESETFYDFNGISHARNWANKYFGYAPGSGYSCYGTEGGRGQGAYVTVTKTRSTFQQSSAQYNADKTELEELRKTFGNTLNDHYNTPSTDTTDVPQLQTWRQPEADFPGSQAEEVNAFLRGDQRSQTFYNFNGLSHANNWACKYFFGHGQGTGYSAQAVVGQNSNGAFVTVTKTRADESRSGNDFVGCHPAKKPRRV